MKAQTRTDQELKNRLQTSTVFSYQQKQLILKQLPEMTGEQVEKLKALLQKELSGFHDIGEQYKKESGALYSAYLSKIEARIEQAAKQLREEGKKAEEKERSQEAAEAEKLID